jgi:hypothetical protein
MVVFLVFFFLILESSRSQWIFFLMGPLMDLVMDRAGPMDFQWIFNGFSMELSMGGFVASITTQGSWPVPTSSATEGRYTRAAPRL